MVRNTVNMKGFIRALLQEGDGVPVMSRNQSLPSGLFCCFHVGRCQGGGMGSAGGGGEGTED